MDINRATIVGRLTRDPESRTTNSGTNVVNFSVATNSAWKDRATGERKEAVEYHNVIAWGKLGEIVSQYMHKGRRVLVEGRLQTRSWDGQDGAKRNRTEIVADNIIMLDSKSATSTGSAGAAVPDRTTEEIQIEEPRPPSARGGSEGNLGGPATPSQGGQEEEISVEDIPF